jgi:hypothetical protein
LDTVQNEHSKNIQKKGLFTKSQLPD